jgi:hypothetical protein
MNLKKSKNYTTLVLNDLFTYLKAIQFFQKTICEFL